MKQIAQNYRTGVIRLLDVGAPVARDGGVLVRTRYSVVSIGTEGMKVREAKLSYLGKAKARPEQVKKVLDSVRQQGFLATYQKVMNKLDSLTPLGYSLSGEVVAVGRGAEEFRVGQHVACAGAGYANHAEMNFVPKNLVVPVPEGVPMDHAAFATVGAIALQGFRQSEMQLGETACVIGLGLLGQLLVQILRAAGIHVVGVDVVEERCRLAVAHGARAAGMPDDPALTDHLARLSGGIGADCVFLTAGGTSNGPTELAAKLARDRGRVVDIGKTRLDLPWNEYYLKELDVRFSRSYGPGRYDANYEERGLDYPAGYVRWTERRNLASFLDLVAEGRVRLDKLVSRRVRFDEAERVYEELSGGATDFLGIVFEYGDGPAPERHRGAVAAAPRIPERRRDGAVRVGVIGAGSYASSMLLPHLSGREAVELVSVATSTSLSAENAKRKFGFRYATTDYEQVLADDGIDAVVIATRHSSHARLVVEALRAGKAVFVEKPLALNAGELEAVRAAVAATGNDRLMVGFNRRFSPGVTQLATFFRGVAGPVFAHYRIHAGRLESGSWYLDETEGSRFAGEAGHFLDVLAYVVDSRPLCVTAACLNPERATRDDRENIAAIVQYENGSVGNLVYLTQGGVRLPKEFVEIFGGGCTAQLDNFATLTLYRGSERRRRRLGRADKGQKAELEAFVEAVRSGAPMPIPLESLFDTTLATFAVPTSVATGKPIFLADFVAPRSGEAADGARDESQRQRALSESAER